MRQNLKTHIVTKLKPSNCDKTQNLKFWQYSKTQIGTKKTQIITKLKALNCDKSPKKLLWQKSTTQIITAENSNCDKTQIIIEKI